MTTSDTETTRRLEPARRRAQNAKRALVVTAGVGFVATVLLARAWNPGTATPSSGNQATPGNGSIGSNAVEGDDDFFGSASIAPSSSSGSPNVVTRSS